MNKLFYLTNICILLIASQSNAQNLDILRLKIQQILSTKNATVGVTIIGNNGDDTLSINGKKHFPLQSVYKFHIALAVLNQIDKGKLSLNQKIEINKKDLLPDLYSPLRDDFPNGASLTISKILEYTVSKSDNIGCDVLLRLIGGAKVVQEYFVKNNFQEVSIKTTEEEQQTYWELQFQNWTTPNAASDILSAYYYNKKKLLSEKSHDFIWKVMKDTETGKKRIKGQLPDKVVVAHKTGTSGISKEGLMTAVNDIGIVFLPNGQHFFISVFVTDSKENIDTNEKIIADIAKVTWDYFLAK